MLKLYDYYRSSACYRVRIALHMKGLDFESVTVDLLAGEQRSDAYKGVNPQGTVPYLLDGDTETGESLAIIEYLDETYGEPFLVYGNARDKAYIRQLSLLIASGIHPLSNPAVAKGYLQGKLGLSEEQGAAWIAHWLQNGLKAYETALHKYGLAGQFSFGNSVSMADLCLIPQLYSARRFSIDLSAFPKILEIEKNCVALESFQKAAPESHPKAPHDLQPIHGPNSPLFKEAA